MATLGDQIHLAQQEVAMDPHIELIRLVLLEIIKETHGEQIHLVQQEAVMAPHVEQTPLVPCVATSA